MGTEPFRPADEAWKMAAICLATLVVCYLVMQAAWFLGKVDWEVRHRLDQLDRIEQRLERLEGRR